MEGILAMSKKKADRLKIISQIEIKALKVLEGSELMGLSARQTYRVLNRIKEEGTKGKRESGFFVFAHLVT